MPIQLETSRLILREFIEADAPYIFEVNSDWEVIKYTGDSPFNSVEDASIFIANYKQYELYHMGRLSMILKQTGEYLGWCGLKYFTEDNIVELGYRMHKRFWNKGYATEASVACLDYGFNTLNLNKIWSYVLVANTASVKVLQKLGMKFERDAVFHDQPGAVYSISKEEWK